MTIATWELLQELWQTFKSHLSQLPLFILILVSLYGVSSYVSMFSVFVELPVFVNTLPEGWNLPTHLIFFVQLSSLGPALYVLLKRYFPDKIEEWMTSIVLLVFGIVCCPLLAVFWDTTVGIGVRQYSVPLYILASLIGLMDSTAQVVFMPYMAPFRPMYITALYFGRLIGGLFTGSVGMLQGLGKHPYCANATYYSYFNHSWITQLTEVYTPPSLSVGSFYWIMEFVLILSMVAFLLLHFHPIGIQERDLYIQRTDERQEEPDKTRQSKRSFSSESDSGKSLDDGDRAGETKHIIVDSSKEPKSTETMKKLKQLDFGELKEKEKDENEKGTDRKSSPLSSEEWKSVSLDASSRSSKASSPSESAVAEKPSLYLNVIVFISCFLSYGLLPSLLPYTCLPYNQSTFNYTARIPIIICPLVCLLAVLRSARSTRTIIILFSIALASGGYQLILAFNSPHPPLRNSWFGPFLTVTTYIAMDAVFNYVLLCCSTKMSEEYGPTGRAWCGSMTQLGCLTGSLAAIMIIDVFQWLVRKGLCDDMVQAMSTSSNRVVVSSLHVT